MFAGVNHASLLCKFFNYAIKCFYVGPCSSSQTKTLQSQKRICKIAKTQKTHFRNYFVMFNKSFAHRSYEYCGGISHQRKLQSKPNICELRHSLNHTVGSTLNVGYNVGGYPMSKYTNSLHFVL